MKHRVVFVDYVRVIACFMVMLVHASENFYGADNSGLAGNMSMLASESNRFWVAFYDGFCGRASVPLFMIISAFLLVPMKSDLTMSQFYKSRFKRILPPTIFFMLLYCFLPLLWGGMTWEQSLADLKHLPWNFPSMAGHLWFMYPLISLYLVIPIISPWLKQSSGKDELIFIGFFAITTFLPFIHMFITPEVWGECFWNQFSLFWYCSGFIGYLVLAHYLRVHLKWSERRKVVVGLLSFLVGASFTAWSFWWKGVPNQIIETPRLEWAWQFCTPNVLLQTFGLFLLATCIRQPKTPQLILTLSKCSFGMYLMHLFFLAPIATSLIAGNVVNPLLPVWLTIPLIAVLTFICCSVTTWIISRLPGSKWLVGA